jgi:hypothetical protein
VIGRVFERLVVQEAAVSGRSTHARVWRCACACGATAVVSERGLLRGSTRSCGCLRREHAGALRRTHGRSTDVLYALWRRVRRCPDYPAAWREDFVAFANAVGAKPTPAHRLTRIAPGVFGWRSPIERTLHAASTRR